MLAEVSCRLCGERVGEERAAIILVGPSRYVGFVSGAILTIKYISILSYVFSVQQAFV